MLAFVIRVSSTKHFLKDDVLYKKHFVACSLSLSVFFRQRKPFHSAVRVKWLPPSFGLVPAWVNLAFFLELEAMVSDWLLRRFGSLTWASIVYVVTSDTCGKSSLYKPTASCRYTMIPLRWLLPESYTMIQNHGWVILICCWWERQLLRAQTEHVYKILTDKLYIVLTATCILFYQLNKGLTWFYHAVACNLLTVTYITGS